MTPAQAPPRERIRISAPQLGPEVEDLVLAVLRSGHLAQGPMVERFEALCTTMAGTAHAIAVSNGTVALDAALHVLDIGPGQEVITSPFTFAATINAILRSGASVRFADIRDDFTVDPDAVAGLIGPATTALMPVHLYGLPADMQALMSLAAANRLAVVEDAAQSHGAEVAGRRSGSFGIGCFSFYATKNVTSGEGGCVTTDDPMLAERLRIARNQGMRGRYDYAMIGQNWRMTDVAAAIAIPQMERLDSINAARRGNAATLTSLLGATPAVTTPSVPAGRTHVWHQYTVLLDPGIDRDRVVAGMSAHGVDAGVYYPALVWDHEAYRHHPNVRRDDTPKALDIASRCLSLPVHPGLSRADLERVAETLAAAVRAA
ncbi:MAG TPA: DegT/DnrJ/EryC1/StrS family aminotransferase [Candidatus Saccharimonadales bacterium]|nr:DegT/DnrJ/EryC1/StrS family aminotransferase [Candidatus Saccharimonadales bacterium]